MVAFVSSQSLDLLYVSTITLAEIRFGIGCVTDTSKRSELIDGLTQWVRPMFAQRILPISEDVIFKWRLFLEEGRKTGHTFPQPDLFFSVIALLNGLTVVSRDTSEYEKDRVPIHNPWV